MSIKLTHDNLVAIAYKTGYCGSLIYALISLSPEVQQFVPFDQLSFNDGTAHEASEQWFNKLHDYTDSLTVSESQWNSYVTPRTQQALLDPRLILFRCHPNTAVKLSFIENLRVLYLTHKNKHVSERWAYEKVYKPMGEQFYQRDLHRLIGSKKPIKISNQIKRKLLIKNLNHDLITWDELKNQMTITPYHVQVDQLLEKNFDTYTELCKYLHITPLSQHKFTDIINRYNSKQWKRF
jgi:hypothetical protein